VKKIFLILLFLSFSVFAKNHDFVVKSGDNLGKYFQKSKISQSVLINLINSSSKTKRLNNLKIGKKLRIVKENNKFKKLVYFYSGKYSLVVELYGTKFNTNFVKNYSKQSQKYTKYQFKISKNLFRDGGKSGLNFSQLQNINKEISKHINTSKLRKNDVFQVFFKGQDLLAIKYFGRKKIHIFNWNGNFYNQDGKVVYDMFLAKPLNYKRISSGFSYNRFHPILKTYRPHRAIDYAANKGVKVFATASGKVIRKGYHKALGNVVEIKHAYGYSTVYAHLSKFAKIYKGGRVKQGQTIGYVGSTGRSTGNHLHYELKNNGKYFNPLKHRPKLNFKLKGAELRSFTKYIKEFK
jgi:murein DD-endopeptidase MepM/ murein hydrolase activator NlpD